MIIVKNYNEDSRRYNRDLTVEYAHDWAFKRNPVYLDFEKYGGDCTNFASQALFEGCKVMNFTKLYGWYYINSNSRSPSWTGVEFFRNFLVNNKGAGPYGEQVDMKELELGDFIQLALHENKGFSHTLIVEKIEEPYDYNNIYVASHSIDRDNFPLSDFNWLDIRYLHIKGVRG